MSADLKIAKERLVQAEQALEKEKQTSNEALLEVQDRLDKRLDESLAIDFQLLSYLKDLVLKMPKVLRLTQLLYFTFFSSDELWP